MQSVSNKSDIHQEAKVARAPPRADEELGSPQQLRKFAVLELVWYLHLQLRVRRLELLQRSCEGRNRLSGRPGGLRA